MKYDGEHENAFPAQEQLKASNNNNNVPVKTRKVGRGRERIWTAAHPSLPQQWDICSKLSRNISEGDLSEFQLTLMRCCFILHVYFL